MYTFNILCICVYIWFHIFFVSFYEGVYVCLVRFSSVRMFFLLLINVNLCGSILILAWAFLSPLVWKIIARNIRSVRVPVSLHTNPDQHSKRDQLLQIKGQSACFLACASSINIVIGSTQTPANANRPIIAYPLYDKAAMLLTSQCTLTFACTHHSLMHQFSSFRSCSHLSTSDVFSWTCSLHLYASLVVCVSVYFRVDKIFLYKRRYVRLDAQSSRIRGGFVTVNKNRKKKEQIFYRWTEKQLANKILDGVEIRNMNRNKYLWVHLWLYMSRCTR